MLSRWSSYCVAAIAVSATLVVLGTAAASDTSVVLGKKHLLRYGMGWGTAHPRLILNGGDPGGKAGT